MSQTKICAHCGKPFTAVKPTRQFCSYACSGASKSKPLPTYVCGGCGKTFTQSKHRGATHVPRFCSHACYLEHDPKRINRPVKTCPQCGKEFTSRNEVHCSQKCQMAAQRTRVMRECVVCGAAFEMKVYVIAMGNGRFCSRTCARTYQKQQRIQCTCLHCGKQFEVIPSQMDFRSPRFCSRNCYRKHAGETKPEEQMRGALEQLALHFEAEFPFLRYHLDFYLPELHLAIEVDGSYWHRNKQEHDAKRDAKLLEHGIRTVRISEDEINTERDLPSFVLSKLSP